jgi:thiamine-phosphate pyrophosphorylase
VCPARYPTPPVIPSRPRRPPPVRVPSVTVTDPRTLLRDARLYLCTDSRTRQGDLSEFLDAVLSAGVDIIQLREKGLEARQEIRLLEAFAEAADRHGKLFAVNDRVDIAAAVHAPILHLGQDDLPVSHARRILGDEPVIGRSTHTPAQFDAAVREPGADYLCAGPIWATPTKPGRPATGLPFLTHASSQSPQRPWFAIGGIENLGRLDQVIAHGARRIVVVRAITTATDPAAATRAIRDRLRRQLFSEPNPDAEPEHAQMPGHARS